MMLHRPLALVEILLPSLAAAKEKFSTSVFDGGSPPHTNNAKDQTKLDLSPIMKHSHVTHIGWNASVSIDKCI